MRRTLLSIALASLAVATACTYGHQEVQSGNAQPLVFPGEARLGASAFMVIDSNQMQIGDHYEHYDLYRDRVELLFEGNLGSIELDVRGVFSLETGRATDDAEARTNSWVTVALFDLPTAAEASGVISAPYPQHARLHLEIDGVPEPAMEGVIWVVGEGGEPTPMGTELLPLLEEALEPRTTVRLRARGDGGDGFQSSWLIGGISAEIGFDPDCLENPHAFAGSNAIKAGVTVGPVTAGPSGRDVVQIVLSHPQGFQLPVAGTVDATRLGTGPILDITFDRIQDVSCDTPLEDSFWIHSLKVRDIDGTLRVSRPGVTETGFDGSEFFHVHSVDPDRPTS
jgi:hypothetical protein